MVIMYVIGAFILGGLLGMVGMAIFSYGPRTQLEREQHAIMKRLHFLEHENGRKRFKPVKDPRPHAHQLIN